MAMTANLWYAEHGVAGRTRRGGASVWLRRESEVVYTSKLKASLATRYRRASVAPKVNEVETQNAD